MLNKLNYSYNNENSIVHKINSSIKLLGLIFYILFSFLKYNNYLFISNIVIVFILILFSNISLEKYFSVIWKLKFLLILTYILLFSNNVMIRDINILLFKIIFFILYCKCIIFTSTREELGKGGSTIFNLFNLIGHSLRRIAINISNVFSFVHYFFDYCKLYYISLIIKGNNVDSSIMDKVLMYIRNLKNIFIESRIKVQQRQMVLLNKLYDKHLHSSYKYRYKLKWFDYLFVIIYLGMFVIYVLKVR